MVKHSQILNQVVIWISKVDRQAAGIHPITLGSVVSVPKNDSGVIPFDFSLLMDLCRLLTVR